MKTWTSIDIVVLDEKSRFGGYRENYTIGLNGVIRIAEIIYKDNHESHYEVYFDDNTSMRFSRVRTAEFKNSL